MSASDFKNLPTLDLAGLRRKYPLTMRNFGALADREAWLRRICELETRWQDSMERGLETPEVIIESQPPMNAEVEATFDVIYAGGVLGLLHAAVMANRYQQKVMVFDAHTVGKTHRDWNISDDELKEFERAGLFTPDELEAAVVNRYQGGFVKFHDGGSRLKTPPLWMNGVLDVALDADTLLTLARGKIEQGGAAGSALLDRLRFVRAYVEPHRVVVEVEDESARGINGNNHRRRFFAARLFVDATGTNSRVARQLNDDFALTHVCPTVGTLARGFKRATADDETDAVDFKKGEILVSTEDASDHRQLIWEGFAGNALKDDYTTYLFFYDAIDSKADKSLLALFERYFESLPAYKKQGAQWRVQKPVFGYIPSFHHRGFSHRKRTATTRVMIIGDAAALSSPLTFCGFGSHVRNLHRTTEMTAQRLKQNALDTASLRDINAYEPRVAQMASLAEFMRPTDKGNPSAVNETMNAVMAALHDLDERVRRELFQDRMSFHALKALLARTARLYPNIFKRLGEHLGVRGTFWWLTGIAEARWSEHRQAQADDETERLSGEW